MLHAYTGREPGVVPRLCHCDGRETKRKPFLASPRGNCALGKGKAIHSKHRQGRRSLSCPRAPATSLATDCEHLAPSLAPPWKRPARSCTERSTLEAAGPMAMALQSPALQLDALSTLAYRALHTTRLQTWTKEWCNMIPILVAIGESPEIAAKSGEYACFLVPFLFTYTAIQPLKFLQAQSLVFVMPFSLLTTLCCVHRVLVLRRCDRNQRFQLGERRHISFLCEALPLCKRTWTRFSRAALRNCGACSHLPSH